MRLCKGSGHSCPPSCRLTGSTLHHTPASHRPLPQSTHRQPHCRPGRHSERAGLSRGKITDTQRHCVAEMAVGPLESPTLAKGLTLLEAVREHLTAEMPDAERGALAEIFDCFQVRFMFLGIRQQVLCFSAVGCRHAYGMSYVKSYLRPSRVYFAFYQCFLSLITADAVSWAWHSWL